MTPDQLSATQPRPEPRPEPQPPSAQPARVDPPPPALTYDLLGEFAKRPGCEAYSAAGEQIKLLEHYLWCRQLVPGLAFEVFLDCFAPLADYSEENRKYPEHAHKHHCPRYKTHADKRGVPKWEAGEVVDITVLYVDMVREAERTGVPVPMTYDEYLAMDGPAYKRGEVAKPERSGRARGTSGKRETKANTPQLTDAETGVNPGVPVQPRQEGQPVIYRHPGQNGRQIRGTVESTSAVGDRHYVTFRTPDGELYEDVAAVHCELASGPHPSPARAARTVRRAMTLTKSQWEAAQRALSMNVKMGNVALGDPIVEFSVALTDSLCLDVQVSNAETGPYIDSQLADTASNTIIETLPPRENLLGEYRVEHEGVAYVVEVKARGEHG